MGQYLLETNVINGLVSLGFSFSSSSSFFLLSVSADVNLDRTRRDPAVEDASTVVVVVVSVVSYQ